MFTLFPHLPHVQVVDATDFLYLVMEHSPNGSLLDYVRSRKKMAEPDAVFVLQQIVAGLQYCHAREVVHRCEGEGRMQQLSA